MIQIIVMHILQFSANFDDQIFTVIMRVLFFFMPWFFFKSGYLYTAPRNGLPAYLLDKSKKLLIPFLAFTLIGFVFAFPFELITSDRSLWRMLLSPLFAMVRWGNGGDGNLPIWFLLSLFFALTGFSLLDKFKLKVLIILFPLAGYALYYYNIALPLGLSNVFLGIFFLYAGYIFRNKIEKSKFIVVFLIACTLIFIASQLFWFSSLDMRINYVTSGNYFVYLISALCGLGLIYFVGKKIDDIKSINYIGENSMVYFVAHWPILLLAKNIMSHFGYETKGYLFAGILAITTFVILPFLIKILNVKMKVLIGK